ncbi:hypothetical protein ACU4I5_10875 [Ensifer adhaerens]
MKALIETREGDWRNDKHAAQWKMTLTKYAKPLHDLPISRHRHR